MGLSWEFPGGKVEKGETFEIALKREIKEELSIEINIKNKLGEENYQDDNINVKLHYFICSHLNGEIETEVEKPLCRCHLSLKVENLIA